MIRAGEIIHLVRGTGSTNRVFGDDQDDRTPKTRTLYFPLTA
jgi:hypothetical protein